MIFIIKNNFEKFAGFLKKQAVPLILFYGILLRLSQYLYNRSLWQDEIFISGSILNLSFSDLFHPLTQGQAAPIGFLLTEKLITSLWNKSEFALRLYPLLTGILSLFVFYKVSESVQKKISWTGLLLFSLCSNLIYYSSEVKQYSSDVFFVLLITLLFLKGNHLKYSLSYMLVLSMAGVIALWFSHPAVFVLIAFGMTSFFYQIKKQNWKNSILLFIPLTIWVINFVFLYFLSYKTTSESSYLLTFWDKNFMPFPFLNKNGITWFYETFLHIFNSLMELDPSLFFMICFLTGAGSLWAKKNKIFWPAVLTIVLTLIASGLKKYPFYGRLILFLIPFFIIFIQEGISVVFNKINEVFTNKGKILQTLFLIILFSSSMTMSLYHLVHPREKEEVKKVFKYIMENYENGDTLYLYHRVIFPYKYYFDNFYFYDQRKAKYLRVIEGIRAVGNREKYLEDIHKLKGKKRVWIAFTCPYPDEEEFFVSQFLKQGIQHLHVQYEGASFYFFDFDSSDG